MRLRLAVALLLFATVGLASAASAFAQTFPQRRDAVSGTLHLLPSCAPEPGCIDQPRYAFDVVSDATGANPQGTVSYVTGERAGTFFDTGAVTCLSVGANRATVGVNFAGPSGSEPPMPHAALIFLEDNGSAASDKIAVQAMPAGTAPSSCPTSPPAGITLALGFPGRVPGDQGVTIVDQQPGPTSKRQCTRRGWSQFGFIDREACIVFVEQTLALGGAIKEFRVPTPSSSPQGISAGPDGAVWFTEFDGNKIGRLSADGSFTEFAIPTANSVPNGITTGPDRALWFVEDVGNKIGRVTTDGSFSEFPVPTPPPTGLSAITAGPDGALWFTEGSFFVDQIGRVTTAGSFTEFRHTVATTFPNAIVAGPDGALWFTELTGGIGRMTTSGTFTEFSIPTPGGGPVSITAGPDGALWFAELFGNKIGRITTSGTVSEFSIPTQAVAVEGIAAGPDGALWFTENGMDRIGRVTTTGTFTEFPLPTFHGAPLSISAGPDNALWFTETGGNKVGRIASRPSSRRQCRHGGYVRFGFADLASCLAFVQQVPMG
jgi:streptogramin lyase